MSSVGQYSGLIHGLELIELLEINKTFLMCIIYLYRACAMPKSKWTPVVD